jgi:hypothetical protein
MSPHHHLENPLRAARHASQYFWKIADHRPLLTAAVLILAAWCGPAGPMSAQSVEESQVRAAYLYNFAKFVEWPAGTFRGPDDPAVICVFGDERTSDVLEQSVSGKRANGRPVESKRPRSVAGCKSCQILFISSSDKDNIAEILRELHGSSVLTVGHSDQFIPLGGIINLARKDSTIELEIDPEAAEAVGLKISSRLLVIARLIKRQRTDGGM